MSAAKKPAVDREAIRALVRQVLRDALPEAVRERIAADAAKAAGASAAAGKPAPSGALPAESQDAKVEEVALTSDAELAAFVRRVLTLAQDPRQREALQSGRIRFRLKRTRKAAEPESAGRGGGERVDKGIVNERKVLAAAKAGRKLVLGKGVVVTPLARDKARQLGVQIERE
ncbi:MAG: hypothetical protein AB7S71_08580 [Dongiaceae bacterium]